MPVIKKILTLFFTLFFLFGCSNNESLLNDNHNETQRIIGYSFDDGLTNYKYTLSFFENSNLVDEYYFKVPLDVQYSSLKDENLLLFGLGGLVKINLSNKHIEKIDSSAITSATFSDDDNVYYIQNLGFSNNIYTSKLFVNKDKTNEMLVEIFSFVNSIEFYNDNIYLSTSPLGSFDKSKILIFDQYGNLKKEFNLDDWGELEIINNKIYLKTKDYLYDFLNNTKFEYGYTLSSPYEHVFINDKNEITTMEWIIEDNKCKYRSKEKTEIIKECHGYQSIDNDFFLINLENKLYLYNYEEKIYKLLIEDNRVWESIYYIW